MKLQIKAQLRRNGPSYYLKVDPYFIKRGLIKEGDWVEYEILEVERKEEMDPPRFELDDVIEVYDSMTDTYVLLSV